MLAQGRRRKTRGAVEPFLTDAHTEAMEAAPLSLFEVVDDFLEPHIYAEVVAQLPGNAFSLADGQVLEIHLPRTVANWLRGLVAPGPPDMLEAAIPVGGDEFSSLCARVHYGLQRDHGDVTLTGHAVGGNVCLVYIAGSGTFVLIDAQSTRGGTPVEHRIEVCPNRAVIWDNSRYTHRVETSDHKVPRIMLGPYTVDPLGKLTPVGANQLCKLATQIVMIGFACGLLICIGILALLLVAHITYAKARGCSLPWGCTEQKVVLGMLAGICVCFSCAGPIERCASCLFSWLGRNAEASDSEFGGPFQVSPIGLDGITDLVSHMQIAFCKQCIAVGKEMLLRKMLRSEDVEERTPTLILSLPAVVTFRFCLRSSRCGDRFVFADGFEVMDSSLPEWNPIVYLFMGRVRAVRTKLLEMNVSQQEQEYMEAKLMGMEHERRLNNLDTERLNDLKWVVSQVNSVAITISRQAFYKERLAWIAETLEDDPELH